MIIDGENYKEYSPGAKAGSLFKMWENGFHVPPFFCVSGEYHKEAEKYARVFFEDSDCVSVRSSASSEDGKNASFAGQFRTELNVSLNRIGESVKRVCSVPDSAGFEEYCKINGADTRKINIFAIVQKMIDADLSGIIFTANPQGILNESVVAVGRGTGDNVVGDKTGSTVYYYNNSDDVYYSEQSGDSPLICEKTLKTLLEQAKKIKELFGSENEYDIEFSIKNGDIFILQARPITTLPKTDSPIVLDNSNIVESYPGITLPLTQSFIRTAYYRVFRSVLLRLTHEPKTVGELDEILRNMVDSANGRIYYRISNWYDIILFLPFSGKIIPIWQEMLGVKNKSVTSHIAKKISFRTHLQVSFSFIYLIITCPKLMRKLDEEFGEMIRFFDSLNLDKASGREIIGHYKNLLDKVTDKWDITLVNDMYSFIFTGLLKARLKAKKVGDSDVNSYISGLNGIESMNPVMELIKIAEFAEKGGELEELKRIRTTAEYREYSVKGSAAALMIAKYIENYGDRNAEELKLESRTFRTDPELLVQRIVSYAENGIPEVLQSSNENIRPLKGLCKLFAQKAAAGIKNREKSRLHRSRLYGMMRSMMLRTGSLLAADGRIAEPRDIFYLEYDEVERAVKTGEDMRALVSERREAYGRFDKIPAYSRLVFAGSVFDKYPQNVGGMEKQNGTGVLEGTPCSGGRARGEVLIIDDPTAYPDTSGKIIVAEMTDPGWVFLLVGAAGIIAEKGSLLSHTAIISRELGKPAIVGVNGAARLLRNGDIVEIDGTSGKITVTERKENEKYL